MTHSDNSPVEDADVELDTDQVRKAQRIVALHSTDVDDCRMLLSMLGIDGPTD
ncbi:hypothetical protein SAMN05444695_102342 [Rhodococcus triatomae]|uniref:Uncharacterized protein n=1 Tax=Rhodococcus triatomae TaxID=300028 RepID=A0A1G8DLZ2_9NOCA|nr:hypothetical protein [Rhodococcus triatomae]SDH58723.1 hypothetical protein SAMN05444695_102342 [Rhodococcus triatomae]